MKTLDRRLGLVFTVMLLIPGAALAQARSQADVRIQSINATQFFSFFPTPDTFLNCDVTVYSDHDDSAVNVVLNVLLPVEVRVTSVPSGCAAIPTSSGAYHSAVQCHLGTLNVGQSKAVRITTTLPRLSVVAKTFGAFAWSLTPDPQPSNNYREDTVTP